MSASPIPPDRLDAEEFRRLGIRPNELRLGVIRKAATRMARALAEQHLRSPSTQTAVQLSRVVTSAYRLLDPRQRTDPHQRAHVGRILPNTLNVAGQTNFSSSSVDIAASISTLDVASTDPSFDSGDQAWPLESIHQRQPASSINQGPLWSIASDVVQSKLDEISDVDQPVRPVDVTSWLSTLSDEDLLAATPRERKFRRLRDRIFHPWVWFSVIGLAVGSGLGWVTIAPRIQNATFRLIQRDRPAQQIDPSPNSAAIAGDASVPASLPDAASMSVIEPESAELPAASTVVSLDDRPMLPDPWADLDSGINGTEITSVDAAMSPVPDSSPLSVSTPAPIVIEPLAEPAIPSPDEAFLAKLSDSRTKVESNQGVPDELWLNGLRLCNQLLMAESFDVCDRVVTAIGQSFDGNLPPDDAGWWSAFQVDVAEMKRLRSLLGDVAGIDGDDDAGLRGQYECLYRREWTTQTLAWLGEWSNVRVAAIARMEIEAGDDDVDIASLAKGWLAVADRVHGRPSDSIRLHAIELMHRSAAEASALQKLTLQRSIEDAVAMLPGPVRRMDDWSKPPAESESAVEPVSEGVSFPSLTGRLLAGSDDLGVRLIYDLDVAITPAMIAAIESRLDRELTDVEMVLSGELIVDEDTTVNLSASMQRAAGEQTITVDNVAIVIDPLEGRTAVTLTSGRHLVRWTVKPSALSSRATLGIHDATTGRRMTVKSTPSPLPTFFDIVMPR